MWVSAGKQESPSTPGSEKPDESQASSLVIRLTHEDPPDDHWGQGATHFKELVEQKSDGKIKVEVYDSGQLGHSIDNIQQLQSGTLEMTLGGSDIVSVDPMFKMFDVPYLFRDREHAKKALFGPVGEETLKVLEKHGLVGLAYWENGFRQITNSIRPITVPDDLKGIEIRTR